MKWTEGIREERGETGQEGREEGKRREEGRGERERERGEGEERWDEREGGIKGVSILNILSHYSTVMSSDITKNVT